MVDNEAKVRYHILMSKYDDFDRPDPVEPWTDEDQDWADWYAHVDEEPEHIVTHVLRDEGTVVLFATKDDRVIAVDHREAIGLVELLDEHGEVPVYVEDWQIIGSAA